MFKDSAMLAAVNSQGVSPLSQEGLQQSLIAAAAAAAASTTSSTTGSPQPQLSESISGSDYYKKTSIREANRERKKKWRMQNEERNKDNDLRCRVNKRATKLFGPNDTEAKRNWANSEFEKRRQKRMEKERRKNIVNNVLSAPSQMHSPSMNAHLAAQLASSGQPQHDTSEQLDYYPPVTVDPAAAAKMLDFPAEIQRQLLEQLNNMMALTSGGKLAAQPGEFTQDHVSQKDDASSTMGMTSEANTSDTSVKIEPTTSEDHQLSPDGSSNSDQSSPKEHVVKLEDNTGQGEDEKQRGKKQEYPMDAVLTLMQLNAGWRQ